MLLANMALTNITVYKDLQLKTFIAAPLIESIRVMRNVPI